jgi:holliday junction DNA helicase RuvB
VTFAAAIAEEREAPFTSIPARTLEKRLDLTGVLSNVRARQILAIRDIDALRPPVLDMLVEALSNFRVDILVGARMHPLPMPGFTLIATTSKPWLVDEQLRRWCRSCKFGSYTQAEAAQIVVRIGSEKGILLDLDGLRNRFAARTQSGASCRLPP